MIRAFRRRYAKSPHPLNEFATDVAAGMIIAAAWPVVLWESVMGRLEQRYCHTDRHWYRVRRLDRTLEPMEWRCRLCGQWKWLSDGKEMHSRPPWYQLSKRITSKPKLTVLPTPGATAVVSVNPLVVREAANASHEPVAGVPVMDSTQKSTL